MTAVLVFIKNFKFYLFIYLNLVVSKVRQFFNLFCRIYTKYIYIPKTTHLHTSGFETRTFFFEVPGSQIGAIPLSHHPRGKTNLLWKKRALSLFSIGIQVPYFIEILVL
jgi:hypothetical protein